MFPRPATGLLVGLDDLLDSVGMFGCEFFRDADHPIAVEFDVAVQQRRAGLQLTGCQQRIEAGPGIHVASFQRGATVGVLQVNQLHIILAQPSLLQAAQGEQERVGAFGGGDLLAFEVGNGLDRRILAHRQGSPFRAAGDVHGLDRAAIGAAQHRCKAGRGGEVDAAAVEVFQRAIAALAEHPVDLGAGQGFFQPAEMAQDQAGGRVVGVVQANLGRGGCLGHAGEAGKQHGGGQQRCGQAGKQGHEDHSSARESRLARRIPMLNDLKNQL